MRKTIVLILAVIVLLLPGCKPKKSFAERLTENLIGEISSAAEKITKLENVTIGAEGTKWPKEAAAFLPEPKGKIAFITALPMGLTANLNDMTFADAKNYYQSLKGMTEHAAQLILKEKNIMYTGYIKDSHVLFMWTSNGLCSINRIVKEFDPKSSDYEYVKYGGEEAFWPVKQLGEIPQPQGLILTDVSVPVDSGKSISMMFSGGSAADVQSYYDKLVSLGFTDIVSPSKGTDNYTFDVRGSGKSITFSWSPYVPTSMEVR